MNKIIVMLVVVAWKLTQCVVALNLDKKNSYVVTRVNEITALMKPFLDTNEVVR